MEESVSKLALRVIAASGPSPSATPYTKRMAIICMRSASKKHFAEALPKMAMLVSGENDLVMQLLYDAQTYVNIHGNRPAYFIEPLLKSLREIQKANIFVHDEHRELLSQLIGLAHRKLMSANSSRDPHHQWQALRDIMDELLEFRHRQLPRFQKNLNNRAKAKKILDINGKKEWWMAVLEEWQTVWTTISNEITPRLGVLREIMLGRQATEFFGQTADLFSGSDLIAKLTNADEAIAFQREFGRMLKLAADSPDNFTHEETRFDLLCKVLSDVLLCPSVSKFDPSAALLQFLHACPCDPHAEIRQCLAVYRNTSLTDIQWNPEGWKGLVFCHKLALRVAINEALNNAVLTHRRNNCKVTVRISVVLRSRNADKVSRGRPCIMIESQGVSPTALYGGVAELGSLVTLVGAGSAGTLATGPRPNSTPLLYATTNVIDRVISTPGMSSGGLLGFDFDDGSALHNSLAGSAIFNTLGGQVALSDGLSILAQSSTAALSMLEGTSAAGDSGAPAFANFGNGPVVVGLVSWGVNPTNPTNLYGSGAGDITYLTRVSSAYDWIYATVPEPGMFFFLLIAIPIWCLRRR